MTGGYKAYYEGISDAEAFEPAKKYTPELSKKYTKERSKVKKRKKKEKQEKRNDEHKGYANIFC